MAYSDTLAADLGRAIERGELFAVFQPQFSAATGSIVAAEALCRWCHAEDGLIPADEFIPLAEQTGDIHAIGRFMLDECFAAIDEWRAEGRMLEVSVNVSPLQLVTDQFSDYLVSQLESRDLAPLSLTIEITETLPVPDAAGVRGRLDALRALGVGVSLDDYGSGHSSRAQLERLPLTELKIDRSLVQAMPVDDPDLRTAIAWSHDHDVRVVAEGIETAEQLDLARELHCDRVQGYLLGRPVPRADLELSLSR